MSLHRAGQLDAARRAYESILLTGPDDPDTLGLLGIVWLQSGDNRKAEDLLRASLVRPADPRVRLRNLNSLVVLLREAERGEEAAALLHGERLEWPDGLAPDDRERAIILSLAEALLLYREHQRARALLCQALPDRSRDCAALDLEGRSWLEDGDHEAAVEILAQACALEPQNWRPFTALSYAQKQSGMDNAARATVQHVARSWSVLAAPPSPEHRASILVLNAAPTAVSDPDTGLWQLHYSFNYPSEIARTMKDEYRFISVFGDLDIDEIPEELPRSDLVINNIVNAERLNVPGRAERVRKVIESIARPVINHPDKVAAVTRQRMPGLLGDIPNLRIPGIERYRRDLAPLDAIASDIDARFAYPVILRLCAAHESATSKKSGGKEVAVLAENGAALRKHLSGSGWHEFYAIEFIDLRRSDGFYRKLRAVAIDRELILTQAAMGPGWLVSGGRRSPRGVAFYRGNPALHEECRRIVLDPKKELGAEVTRTLETIRDRLGLEMFGVDFEVDSDGRVVVFEASASMIFLSSPELIPPDVRLPVEPRLRVNEAFRRMVADRLAGAS